MSTIFYYDHLNNITKPVKSFPNDINVKGENGQSDLLNSPITIDEIQKAIRKLKCQKTASVDSIPAEFSKHGCNKLLPALVLLFNIVIGSGEYPSSWTTGIIHPVHKIANHNVPNNYRNVTIMQCIGELLESVLNNRMSFKMMYAMIIIFFEPALKVTPGKLIIYLYYVPL